MAQGNVDITVFHNSTQQGIQAIDVMAKLLKRKR